MLHKQGMQLRELDAKTMFETERASLQLLEKTGCVQVPQSMKVFSLSGYGHEGSVHVLEYIADLQPMKDHWAELGKQVARLHTFNSYLRKKEAHQQKLVHKGLCYDCGIEPVDKFGSEEPHFIGTFSPKVGWRDTWEEYFIVGILHPLFGGLEEKYGDRKLGEKWSSLQRDIHKIFKNADIQPEINHGDLCPINFGQTSHGPIVFDPSVNYADPEFDLILASTEGGFHEDFFSSYRQIIPTPSDFKDRLLVYTLFYNVVMWYFVGEEMRTKTHQAADDVQSRLLQTEDSS